MLDHFRDASARDHPWPERSVRSDSLEHDSRGWKEPSLPGGRAGCARDRLPVISSEKAAVGLVNILDLLFDRAQSNVLGAYMRRIVVADENESAYRVIRRLRAARLSLAAVINAQKQLLGIVTVEDLIKRLIRSA